jgi:hypothetical protein
MSKYARRVDGNQSEIFALWRDLGAHVVDTSRFGGGFPDCLVLYRGQMFLAEIKNGAKAEVKKGQVEFHAQFEAYGGRVWIIRNRDDALAMLGLSLKANQVTALVGDWDSK